MTNDQAKKPGTQSGVVVELEDPVKFNGEIKLSLTFRKRKVSDLVAADSVKGMTKKEAAVLASMAEVPLPVILDLSSDDYDAVLVKVEPLMGKSWEAVKTNWLAEGAMDMGLTAGIQAELASRNQASD